MPASPPAPAEVTAPVAVDLEELTAQPSRDIVEATFLFLTTALVAQM